MCVWQLAPPTPHPALTLQSGAARSMAVFISHEHQWGCCSAGHVRELLWYSTCLVAKVILVMWLPNTMDTVLAKRLYIALEAC